MRHEIGLDNRSDCGRCKGRRTCEMVLVGDEQADRVSIDVKCRRCGWTASVPIDKLI